MITSLIAGIFREIAKILELKGENVFRIRAYERAAQNIESLSEDIQDIINENRLTEIPGIGKDLAEKIVEIATTGKLSFLEDMRRSLPPGMVGLLAIPSVGPKHAKLFYEKLGIKNSAELEKACREKKLLELSGIKEKTIENILQGIALVKKGRERMDLGTALTVANEFIAALKNATRITQLAVCGSLRRMKETIRDIDILVSSPNPQKIMEALAKLPQIKDSTAQGETKASVITQEGTQVDIRVVKEKSYGAALVYFTGSKNFNIKIRQRAMKYGLKVNEYGVFRIKNGKEKYISGKTEEAVFKSLGLSYIEPELREDAGEIELAATHRLPQLLTLADIKGDFHAHSRYSDGHNSIAEMAQCAKGLGYEYITISDHSQGLTIAKGLTLADLKKKKMEIENLNKTLKVCKVLFGSEVDIDSQGRLDYPDTVLADFDIVVAAIHTGFKQSKKQITKRLLAACKNEYVDIIAHPTGRLWGTRDAYEADFDDIFRAASDYGTALEINAYPLRLDLNDTYCRQAKKAGARLAISTDAHAVSQLQAMHLGVATARRGWLTKNDVLNSLSYGELIKTLKH
ncbi:MAG: hypothetical protein A2Y00_03400 [Omnitrophica WOR_2 bacterium GWF2_43_52]|nr:MAG: hypothetical protein A2062_06730 [Omnitrophica WOR_2 bacterium GWA2_44_7]OGX22481.1 MAG: hypothetical protein A2Y00_03400 [Omnitrophica WOR_2 bacterium GWF2_43_52]OGX57296.1 MAG: hypothetical protein A2460_01640 [Omnitrophica WOR_2 bacterium RIFOXYC2_FULL_43_9]HAH21518.1 DNA polymerase/3'-5' exonuclease PolX [Candidatus Omnitrophota bacterium]HBG64568.1 DNA polymerase/3'-5' exonuclease PolX [Candidatus Omnitrophota bacterium]